MIYFLEINLSILKSIWVQLKMNSNECNNIYCGSAITVKNYISALLGSILLVILSSFVFDFSFIYALIAIFLIILVFYIEVNYANDFSFVNGSYLTALLQSEDQKLVKTINSILDSNGYVTIADLEKVKRTIQQDSSMHEGLNTPVIGSVDLVESVIVRYLSNNIATEKTL